MWHIDLLLGSNVETNETTAVARWWPACQWTDWKPVFSVQSVPRCYKQDKWWVRGLSFSHELLLLGAGSWGTGIVWEPRGRGTSPVGSHYQTMTGEDTADWEDLVHAVVNCRVCESMIALELLVVMICKWSINSVYQSKSHLYSLIHVTLRCWKPCCEG
jgi:hypothetical protein